MHYIYIYNTVVVYQSTACVMYIRNAVVHYLESITHTVDCCTKTESDKTDIPMDIWIYTYMDAIHKHKHAVYADINNLSNSWISLIYSTGSLSLLTFNMGNLTHEIGFLSSN